MRKSVLIASLIALAAPAPASAAPIPFGPIGDQFRVSFTGADNDETKAASHPVIAYDARADRYLVVWSADPVGDEEEVFGRVFDGAGQPASPVRQISRQGPDGDAGFSADEAAIVYNRTRDEFLMAWTGTTAADDGDDIFVRRVSSAGVPLGGDPARISNTADDTSDNQDGETPSVAWNSADDEYLVAWTADDSDPGHNEIYVQRLRGSDAGPVGGDDVQISDTGPDDTSNTSVDHPNATYNASAGEFLIAFSSVGDEITLNGNSIRIQRLGPDGAERGDDDRRISDDDSDANFVASTPDLAFDPATNRYLVAWRGGVDGADQETQVRGLSGTGAPVTDQEQISVAGTGADDGRSVDAPELVPGAPGEFVVVWSGDETGFEHSEIRGQRVTTDGLEVGPNDFALSTTGLPDDPNVSTGDPAVAANPLRHEIVSMWAGSPGAAGGLATSKVEIFGRRMSDGSGRTADPKPAGRPAPGQPPAVRPPVTGVPDGTPPVLTLRRGRAQRILRTRALRLTVTSDDAALFRATGTVELPGNGARTVRLRGTRTRRAGRRATLKLAAPKRVRRLLRSAFRRKRSLRARVTVTATNSAGLKSSRRATVRLVP